MANRQRPRPGSSSSASALAVIALAVIACCQPCCTTCWNVITLRQCGVTSDSGAVTTLLCCADCSVAACLPHWPVVPRPWPPQLSALPPSSYHQSRNHPALLPRRSRTQWCHDLPRLARWLMCHSPPPVQTLVPFSAALFCASPTWWP